MKPNLTTDPHATTMHKPLSIGITGGIGSGKSYVCKQLEQAGHPVFYCDNVAKHIIRTHNGVKQELTELVGNDLYATDGTLVKSVLAAYLCKGTAYSHQVDAIVHPRVAEAFKDFCQLHATTSVASSSTIRPWLHGEIQLSQLINLSIGSVVFMECALLFESGFDRLVDTSVLVHVSHATQVKRLMERDHISFEKAQKWIALQLSEEDKLQRVDAYVINE